MKKLLVIVAFSVILTGCNLGGIAGGNDDLIENEYSFEDDYEYVTKIDGYKHIDVPIDNDTDFELGSEELDLFYDESKYIPSVEFENYVNLMADAFDEDLVITFDKDSDTWTALYDTEDVNEYVEFDFMNNTIKLSSIEMIDNAFKTGESASELVEILELYYEDTDDEIIEESTEMIIELSDYDIELVSKDDNHLIPMHLLFFFFSAYDNDFYYTGETAYYTDLFSSDKAYDIISESKSIEYTDEMISFADSFTILLFENFYGLKDIREDELYALEEGVDDDEYLDEFNNYISGFDEDHTSVVLYTYGGTYLDLMASYNFDDPEYDRIGCYEGATIFATELSDDTVLIEVNSLSDPDFAEDYFKTLDKYRDKENIILDIKCNGGGYVANAPVMLYPFVDDPVDLYAMTLDGGQSISSYIKTDEVGIETITDANVYLVTSDNTFSAANLTASLFAENEVGKIIGEKSGGGTAAIAIVSHPSGAVISMSFGSLVLTDSDFGIIEDGITPDIPYTFNAETYEEDLLEIVE